MGNMEKLAGKRFLVTGGAGFIGSNLVDMLLEHDIEKVLVFDNFIRGGLHNLQNALQDKRVELFETKGDLCHTDELYKATKGVYGAFHLASLCLGHCQEFPRAGLETNVVGTFNLFDACVQNGVKRVVFASSSSIYGNAVRTPMDEEHPWGNKNFYGATKIAGEALARAFYHKYGLEYVALRFMNIYGPRQDYLGAYVAVIIKMIDRIMANSPPVVDGDGSQAFDFVYVDDACRACLFAMVSQIADCAYNVSSGVQTSVIELCSKIKKIMKSDVKVDFRTVHDATLVTNRIGSTAKARTELGFRALTSIDEGLEKTVQWRMDTGR